MSHIMRKPVNGICEQQSRRSACTSAIWSAPLLFAVWIVYYSRNFKTLASLICWAGRFEYYLVANPEDRFSCDKTQISASLPTHSLLNLLQFCLSPSLSFGPSTCQHAFQKETISGVHFDRTFPVLWLPLKLATAWFFCYQRPINLHGFSLKLASQSGPYFHKNEGCNDRSSWRHL